MVRELDRVVHQIGQHLFEAQSVAQQVLRYIRQHPDQELDALFLRLVRYQRGDAVEHIIEPEGC